MGSLKKIPKAFIVGWILIIVVSCLFLVGGYYYRLYNAYEYKNATVQVFKYIILGVISLACLFFFPVFIVGINQNKILTGKYRMVNEIMLIVFTYLLNILFLSTFCYMNWKIDYFDCVLGFYNLVNSNILGLMQLIIGVIFNTTLLSLLVNVYQSRMTLESKEDKNVRLTMENKDYIFKYKLTDVIKK